MHCWSRLFVGAVSLATACVRPQHGDTSVQPAGAESWHFTDRGVWRVGGSASWSSAASSSGPPDSPSGPTSYRRQIDIQVEPGYFVARGVSLGLVLQDNYSRQDADLFNYASSSSSVEVGPAVTILPFARFASVFGETRKASAVQPYVTAFATLADGRVRYDVPASGPDPAYYVRDKITGHAIGASLGMLAMLTRQVGLDVALQWQRGHLDYHSRVVSGPAVTTADYKIRGRALELRVGVATFVKRRATDPAP